MGTVSWGFVSCPLTTWFDWKSFLPSVFGLSLCWSGCGFSWASCWFWELKLFVLSGTLSGALGFASTYRLGGGGFGTRLDERVGRDLDVELLQGRACARGRKWMGSERSRYGAVANSRRWTSSTASDADQDGARIRVRQRRAPPSAS